MSNTKHVPTPLTASTAHVIITAFLSIAVTALCCYTFYVFRTSSKSEQTLTDVKKVIQAATEIVVSIAERGLPQMRGRIDELETRGRMFEQYQKKTGSIIERLITSGGGGSAAPPTTQDATAATNEAAILAARRAARTTTAG